MDNPLSINPGEVANYLEELLKGNEQASKKQAKADLTQKQPVETTEIPGRMSFEKMAEQIIGSHPEGAAVGESAWPDMSEVESILSQATDEISPTETKVVLRGILRHLENLSGYVEATAAEQISAIESLTRKVEFLGVSPSQKVKVSDTEKRPTFGPDPGSLSSFFQPGATPPTSKSCKTKLKLIINTIEGDWVDPEEIDKIPQGKIAWLKENWNEGSVKALIQVKQQPAV